MMGMAAIGLQSMFSALTSLAGPLTEQVVSNTPLRHLPNPISTVGSVIPPSIVSAVVSGLPFGAATATESGATGGDVMAFESKDLKELNEQLEKLGGMDARQRPS